MMAPMSNPMNPGTMPLQQPNPSIMNVPGAEPIENHLGNYSNFANLGSATNLHQLSMTSHLDSIVPKVEPGITTVAGGGVSNARIFFSMKGILVDLGSVSH